MRIRENYYIQAMGTFEQKMFKLISPHGGELKPLLLKGEALKEAMEEAKNLPRIRMTSRERDDLIMMGIGAFSPLRGFMGKADWQGVCDEMKMVDGTFWPIPITLSVSKGVAKTLKEGQEVALIERENDELMGLMVIEEKYKINKAYECKQVFKTDDIKHPGVAKVIAQGEINIGGPVKVFSEGEYPKKFNQIPTDALVIKPLKIDLTFYCYRCKGMASPKTCPHEEEDHLTLSGTLLRKLLTEGDNVPEEFSRPEVLNILKEYYSGFEKKAEIH